MISFYLPKACFLLSILYFNLFAPKWSWSALEVYLLLSILHSQLLLPRLSWSAIVIVILYSLFFLCSLLILYYFFTLYSLFILYPLYTAQYEHTVYSLELHPPLLIFHAALSFAARKVEMCQKQFHFSPQMTWNLEIYLKHSCPQLEKRFCFICT